MKVTIKPRLWAMMLMVFVLTSAATVMMWSFLRGQETRRAATLLVSASGTLQDRVQAELDQELNELKRMAAAWQHRPAMSREEWESEARHVLESHPSLLALSWLENPLETHPDAAPARVIDELKVTWALPSVYAAPAIKLHTMIHDQRPELLESLVQQKRIRISEPILVADRGKAFIVYVPAVVNGKLKGAVAGLFHLQNLMDFVFDRLLASDYSLRLADGYEEIYARGEEKARSSDWEQQGTLQVFSASYRMRLWPSPAAQRANERLADLILMGGLALAVLLAILVYFASKRPVTKVAAVSESRKRLEDRLRLWEAAIGSLDEPVFLAEPEAVIGTGPRVLFVNEAFLKLTGYEAADLIGKSPRVFFGGKFPASDSVEELRTQVTLKSGKTSEVDLKTQPLRNSQDRVAYWLATVRTKQPAAAADSTALLENIVASAPLPVQVFDFSGDLLMWNHLAEGITGFSAKEMVGRSAPIGVQFPPSSFVKRNDLHFAHKNGNRLDLAVWTAPLHSSPGKYLSVMVDLTREHLEAEALAEREASFRALVENASDILAILDLDSTLRYVNPAVREVLGLDPVALTGASADVLIEEAPASDEPYRLRLKQADESSVEMECKLLPIENTSLLMFSARPPAKATAGHAMLEAIPDAVVTYDTERRIVWMNHAAEALYGVNSVFAKGRTWNELLPDWLQSPSRESVFADLDRRGVWQGEVSIYTAQGRELVLEVSMAITYGDGNQPNGAVSICRDVTGRKPAVDALEETAPTQNADALWDWNLRTGDVYFSPGWKAMLGYADEEITTELEEWLMLVHPDDAVLLRGRIAAYVRGQEEPLEVEYRARTRAGAYRWMRTRAAAVRNSTGEITRLVGLQTDIHEQKQQEEQLLFEAFHDAVTGLDNRALFLDRLNGMLAHPQEPFAVVFLDLNHFRQVNEALGLRGGDKALAEAGKRILEALPPRSFMARHGGDEFVAMIPSASRLEDLLALINSRLAQPFEFAGKTVHFSASAGIALSNDRKYEDAEAMVQAASQSLAGGVAPKEHAVSMEQFRVFYHPIVALETGEIAGMEALIRWQHPERGLLTPGDFLSAAEASGMILEIDRWMMHEACARVAALNKRFERTRPLMLSVNLSGRHFQSLEAMAALERIIRDSGMDPANLRIEINSGGGSAQESLDVDFDLAGAVEAGTMKLPRNIVKGLATGRNLEQARAIIGEARRQNRKVVAEGVESLEQLAVLRELKCDLAQGFYFTRPASAKDTERLLARGPRW